ncbi:citramalate synthase [bacterium]|nr:citramalate synthase [bacterium]
MPATISIFDTTLRDGSQGEDVAFSVDDKLRIAHRLDDFGVDYIEGGWPGSNPKDIAFFERARSVEWHHATITAFGATRRADRTVEEDPNLQALVKSGAAAVAIFGKCWLLHVTDALGILPETNLTLIEESVAYLKQYGREVIFDAEHFFDGYKDNPDYALSALLAAQRAGADMLVLCDTNGGTLTSEIARIVAAVKIQVDTPLGIHAHNDGGLAVANSIAAVENGCVHVQGTINGLGERCGNADLCTVIPNLQLKLHHHCIDSANLERLAPLSRFVSEVANMTQASSLPYVGKSAFAHKGGVHVSAVRKNALTYEHIRPEQVGNMRRVLVSDLSGRANVLAKAEERCIDLGPYQDQLPAIVNRIKVLEHDGYQFEAAEGSFELLIRKMTGQWTEPYHLEGFRVMAEKDGDTNPRTEVSIRLNVCGETEHTASEGMGPVHALDQALRKALARFYPDIDTMRLIDYKVRVLTGKAGTRSRVRVLITSATEEEQWCTVGVSENILEASWQALTDSFSIFLMKRGAADMRLTIPPITQGGDYAETDSDFRHNFTRR